MLRILLQKPYYHKRITTSRRRVVKLHLGIVANERCVTRRNADIMDLPIFKLFFQSLYVIIFASTAHTYSSTKRRIPEPLNCTASIKTE
ncbi:hypothetical protein CW304_05815 [Bacillus sp. UFRGS-B20]|nr:hypothetical protein CW304_05815 [Bacillus sp. UFRGS-B20]